MVMEILTSLALGMGLSASCGFRVFVPPLLLSVAGVAGYYTPADEFAWMSSWAALTLFATATLVEITAYYIPWLDNLLDTIASPAAVFAGVLATASVLGDLPPALQWALAAVLGGGSAGLVQAGTVILRSTSSLTTGGIGNPVVATIENLLSITTTLLALVIPFVVATLVLVICGLVWWRIVRARKVAVT